MPTKVILAIFAVFAIAASWWFRDSPPMRTAQAVAKDALPDNSYSSSKKADDKSAARTEKSAATHTLKKCVSDGRTIYTDEKCPAGTREAPISEGNVTVVPGQRAVEKKKSEDKAK